MRCGAPATGFDTKKFSWHPQWVWVLLLAGLLPLIIVAMIVTKRMTVRAPFCDEHRNHWTWRSRTMGLTMLAVVVIGLASLIVLGMKSLPEPLPGLACAGAAVLALVWLVAIIWLQSTSIEAKEITDHHITLNRVASAFCDAVTDQRQANPYRLYDDALAAGSSFSWVPIVVLVVVVGSFSAVVMLAAITTIGKSPVGQVAPAGPAGPVAPIVEPAEHFRLNSPGPEWILYPRAEGEKIAPGSFGGAQRDNGTVSGMIYIHEVDNDFQIAGHENEVARDLIQKSNSTGKRIEAIEPVDYRGLKAVHYRYSGRNKDGSFLVENTVFVYHGKSYQLFCVGPVGTPRETFQPFFDAFELLPVDEAPK
jgi:hypothetical protein